MLLFMMYHVILNEKKHIISEKAGGETSHLEEITSQHENILR